MLIFNRTKKLITQSRNQMFVKMKVNFLILMFGFTFSNCQLFNNEPQLVFNIYYRDIHIVRLEKLKHSIDYIDTHLFVNTTGFSGEIDYSMRANVLIWRKCEPQNVLYVIPIDKR
jgi:hypothetical protein